MPNGIGGSVVGVSLISVQATEDGTEDMPGGVLTLLDALDEFTLDVNAYDDDSGYASYVNGLVRGRFRGLSGYLRQLQMLDLLEIVVSLVPEEAMVEVLETVRTYVAPEIRRRLADPGLREVGTAHDVSIEMTGRIPEAPPSGDAHPLSGRQQALYVALHRKDPGLASMYMGSVLVLRQTENPERHRQSAHTLRQMVNAMPAALGLDAEALTERTSDALQKPKSNWSKAIRRSKCHKDGEWSGEIDEPLRRALVALAGC